jgi:hypothetical protein
VRHCTRIPKDPFPFDLHVLSTPPAFVLSQNQTLQLNLDAIHISSRMAMVLKLAFNPKIEGAHSNTRVLPLIRYSVFKEQLKETDTKIARAPFPSPPRGTQPRDFIIFLLSPAGTSKNVRRLLQKSVFPVNHVFTNNCELFQGDRLFPPPAHYPTSSSLLAAFYHTGLKVSISPSRRRPSQTAACRP